LQSNKRTRSDDEEINATTDLQSIAILYNSDKLRSVMERINQMMNTDPQSLDKKLVEEHGEYELIVESNQLAGELENEILNIYKYIRELYAPRFPELSSLILNPLDYVRAVKLIGNRKSLIELEKDLKLFLQPATVMVLTVTATTAPGKLLGESVLAQVMEACDQVLRLEDTRNQLTNYVATRMTIFAPNLSVIVGSRIAALLMSASGGLVGLSRIASCNLPALGSSKRVLAGFSSATIALRNGYIWGCDVVQSTPSEYQKKAIAFVAAKVALASRVDAIHQSRDGQMGRDFLADIQEKLDRLMEPPPLRDTKALQAPIFERGVKRRGGKRARKTKERQSMSQTQKLQNRLGFNVPEDEVLVGDELEGLGLLGREGSNNVRAPMSKSK
jgi:U4/U6 small nuclear ribonucleoprotein PRP31